MNFLKDVFNKKNKRKNFSRRKTDINFFHTVREGTRKYKGRNISTSQTSEENESNQNDFFSVKGRTIIRPSRYTFNVHESDTKTTSVLSILGNRGSTWVPPPNINQYRGEENSFFKGFFNSPERGVKRKKIDSWEFQQETSILETPQPGPSRVTTDVERHIYLDDPDQTLALREDGREDRDSPVGREDRVFTNKGTFISASNKGKCSSSDKDSFFKMPQVPSSCSEERYDNLFSTPSRTRTLPRIRTPHLFPEVAKSTPVKKSDSSSHSKLGSSTKTPKSTGTLESEGAYVVVGLTEGRGCAVGEVGLAAIDIRRPFLILCQFSDSQTYKKTLAKLNILNPAELIIPDTFERSNSSVLYKSVTGAFTDMTVVSVKRQRFSAKHGLESIRSLCLEEDSSLEMVVHKKYYSLAATEALLKYLEIKYNMIFSSKSLKMSYESATDVISMDLETCRRLELVFCNAEMINPERYSLFGVLNHTVTLGGKRKLRSSLLQAWSSAEIILSRQAAVALLATDSHGLNNLQTALLKFADAERLLWLCLKTPNFRNESKTCETLTNYVLLLKSCLESLPSLRSSILNFEDDYIMTIRDGLYDARYNEILNKISYVIHEDAKPMRGYAASSRQRCFAIKEGINSLLDVARATYSSLIEKVMDLVGRLGEEHKLSLRMSQSQDMGFHAVYVKPKGTTFHEDVLPNIFTEVKEKGRTIHLATDEMHSYNMRIKRALQEVELISNVVMYELTESLRPYIGCLYRLCEASSELDFLSCLAKVSSSPDYCRPVFGEVTRLIGARHPIMDHLRPTKPIPNNVYASKTKNLNIITGPNMGGKTVYVLQIPLIQIMAQIGCFVPADEAEIRITDHIYVRKGQTDSIECKSSFFTLEMKEVVYTLKNLTETSVIIFDELCTGTAPKEGTSVAWGICEELLGKSAFIFLVTHYHYLTNLEKVFPNVTNFHMEAIERADMKGLTLTHRLLPGITQETNYGLKLIMNSNLPEEMKKGALEVAEEIVRRRAASLPLVIPIPEDQKKMYKKISKIESFMENLYGLSLTENFTVEIIKTLQEMAIEEILTDEENDENKINDKKADDNLERNGAEDKEENGTKDEYEDEEKSVDDESEVEERTEEETSEEKRSENAFSVD